LPLPISFPSDWAMATGGEANEGSDRRKFRQEKSRCLVWSWLQWVKSVKKVRGHRQSNSLSRVSAAGCKTVKLAPAAEKMELFPATFAIPVRSSRQWPAIQNQSFAISIPLSLSKIFCSDLATSSFLVFRMGRENRGEVTLSPAQAKAGSWNKSSHHLRPSAALWLTGFASRSLGPKMVDDANRPSFCKRMPRNPNKERQPGDAQVVV